MQTESYENLYLIIFLLYSILISIYILRMILIKKKADRKLNNNKTTKEQIQLGQKRGQYQKDENYKLNILNMFSIIIFIIFIIFLFYQNIVDTDNSMKLYPFLTLIVSVMFYTRTKSIDNFYFWKRYLDNHPDNELDIVLLPIDIVIEQDKKLDNLVKLNAVFTLIFIILGFLSKLY